MKSLSEFVTNPVIAIPTGLASIKDKKVTITDFVARGTGKRMFVIMYVTLPDGKPVYIKTQAKHILAGLGRAYEANAFPVECTFSQVGKQWVVS
jgi:hypothetical protein